MSGVSFLLALAACDGPREPADRGEDLVDASLERHGVTSCADPATRDRDGPWQARRDLEQLSSVWTWEDREERNTFAVGLMVGDLDGDGRLDVLSPTLDGLRLSVGGAGGELSVDPLQTFAGFSASFGSGGSLADYDGDGDLDVYVTRVLGPTLPGADGRNLLLRNEGGGGFTDVTDEAGVSACGVHHRTGLEGCFRSMASSWADYDRDGDLDLYVGNYGWIDPTPGVGQHTFEPGEPDFLYRNEGDGTFADQSDALPPEAHDGYTYAGGFHDLDDDHQVDLYIVNDFGALYPNHVLWNVDGELAHRPDDRSNLQVPMTGMGLAAGDLDGDGWLDLVVSEWARDRVLESSPPAGIWVDTTNARALLPDLDRGQQVAWGGELGDLDLDGDLDLVMQYGHLFSDKRLWRNAKLQPDAIYMNEPDSEQGWRFVDRGPDFGIVDDGPERGGMLVDLDRDGHLDLLKRTLEGPDPYYLSSCGDRGWLLVHLRQPGTMNVFAVGARIEVRAGSERWRRDLLAGGTSFASAGPPEAHFGVGDRDRVDRIRVWWPDGAVSEVADVDTRQQITITREP